MRVCVRERERAERECVCVVRARESVCGVVRVGVCV